MDADVLDLLAQVRPPEMDLVGVLRKHGVGQRPPGDDAVLPGMRLQGPDRGDEDSRVGAEARRPALDVEETFRAHVRAEAGLGDQVVTRADPDLVGQDRRVAVGDIAERTGMDEHRRVLERLEQVGLDGVAHDGGHGPRPLELLGGDGLAGHGVSDHDPPQTEAQVGEGRGQRQDGHDLGGGGDVEAALAGDAVLLRPQPDHDVAQAPVVDVEDAAPRDVVDVESEPVALVEVVVDHGRQQVVGGRDGMEVASEVEVEQLHRDDLAVAPAGRAALDAEGRTHRRLADGDGRLLADVAHGLTETDGRGRLTLAEGGWRHRRDHDVAGQGPVGQLGDGLELDLGQLVAVGLQQMGAQAHGPGDLDEGTARRALGDLQVGRERHRRSSFDQDLRVPRRCSKWLRFVLRLLMLRLLMLRLLMLRLLMLRLLMSLPFKWLRRERAQRGRRAPARAAPPASCGPRPRGARPAAGPRRVPGPTSR